MSKFIIEGGRKLKGEIEISGAKNAATPILAATLLADGDFVLDNIPDILDVRRMMTILEMLGAKVEYNSNNHRAIINTTGVKNGQADFKEVKRLRSSILLMGPLLARFKQVKMMPPGGCNIGNRPVEAHFEAMSALGARVKTDKDFYYLNRERLVGSTIILPEFSVTATENALMAAVLASGQTIIKLAAAEPHTVDLGNFLIKIGAKIIGLGTHTLTVNGVKKLSAVNYKIIPDQIESGTFLVLGALVGQPLIIKGASLDQLDLILLLLKKIGVEIQIIKSKESNLVNLSVTASRGLKFFNLQTLPYPGFPTDLQSVFAVLATQAKGSSLIHDAMYEGRLKYINELLKMGAQAIICDPHRAMITGPTKLSGAKIESFDLRSGASLIIAALVASGKTIIGDAEQVDRGYEKIDEKLRMVGAEIRRLN